MKKSVKKIFDIQIEKTHVALMCLVQCLTANKCFVDGCSTKDQGAKVTFSCKCFYKIDHITASVNFLTGKFT